MARFGIISGTVSLQGKDIFAHLTEKTVENEFGHALVLLSEQVAFIPRHGMPPHGAILPHLINHQANLQALKDLGVSHAIGINSAGSLKRHLQPGMLAIPDDFIHLGATPTIYRDKLHHITPALNDDVRQRLINTAGECGIAVAAGGVYWQTMGPRLETRAEIRMMSQFADLVGMTMASEAIIAQELDLPYASLCTIDNFAHGLVREGLAMEEIRHNARLNADAAARILTRYAATSIAS